MKRPQKLAVMLVPTPPYEICGLGGESGPILSVQRVGVELGRVLLLPEDYKAELVPLERLPEKFQGAIVMNKDTGGALPSGRFYDEEHIDRLRWFWEVPRHLYAKANLDAGAVPDSYVNRLAPEGMEALPVREILWIIALFLLAASPIDYFILGKLGCRIWTWAWYPAIATLSTVLVVYVIMNRRAVSPENNGVWEIFVLGEKNEVLRTTRLEMHLPLAHGELSLDFENALSVELSQAQGTAAVSPPQMGGSFGGVPRLSFGNGLKTWEVPGWTVVGSYPARVEVRRPVAMWDPVLIRVDEIGPRDTTQAPLIDWVTDLGIDRLSLSNRYVLERRLESNVKKAGLPPGSIEVSSAFDSWADATGRHVLFLPSFVGDDFAMVAINVVEGNRYTTYVRFFERKIEP